MTGAKRNSHNGQWWGLGLRAQSVSQRIIEHLTSLKSVFRVSDCWLLVSLAPACTTIVVRTRGCHFKIEGSFSMMWRERAPEWQ